MGIYKCVNTMRWGSLGAICEGSFHRRSAFWAEQLLTEEHYPVYSGMFIIPTHHISVPHPVELNDSHCENKKSAFQKFLH